MKERRTSPRVLVADDDAGHLRLIQIVLNRIGWRYQLATNGREAVEMARQGSFDLILLDLRMPQMDGFQAARRIRELGVSSSVVALTALDYPGLAADCTQAGYNGWLVKPITPRALERSMNQFLTATAS